MGSSAHFAHRRRCPNPKCSHVLPPVCPVLPLELETTLVDSYRHPSPLINCLLIKAQTMFSWTMLVGEDLQSVTTHHRKLWEKTTKMYWIERARFGPPSLLFQFWSSPFCCLGLWEFWCHLRKKIYIHTFKKKNEKTIILLHCIFYPDEHFNKCK